MTAGPATVDPRRAMELSAAWRRPDPGVEPRLAEEFERLFVGPGPVPCPPYESYWRTDGSWLTRHTLMGPCVGDLVKLYAALGVRVSPDAAELPDHLAVELEALAVAAADDAEPDVAAALLNDHLAVWVPGFCAAVAEHTGAEHYRALAEGTVAWVASGGVATSHGSSVPDEAGTHS